jgi:hypothetical protein
VNAPPEQAVVGELADPDQVRSNAPCRLLFARVIFSAFRSDLPGNAPTKWIGRVGRLVTRFDEIGRDSAIPSLVIRTTERGRRRRGRRRRRLRFGGMTTFASAAFGDPVTESVSGVTSR